MSDLPTRAEDLSEDGTTEVKHCPDCGCKTWHFGGVCEWSDGHKPKVAVETGVKDGD